MANSTNETKTTSQQKTVNITRTFNLPIDAVWKAFSEVESFKKWWGPEGFTCPHCTIDFRIGGKYFASMQGPDGKEIWSTGTYKEIVPKKKIVYLDSFADSLGNSVPASYYNMPGEWPKDSLVTLTFEDLKDKTKMNLLHTGIPEAMYEDCIDGWNSSLDKIEKKIK